MAKKKVSGNKGVRLSLSKDAHEFLEFYMTSCDVKSKEKAIEKILCDLYGKNKLRIMEIKERMKNLD